MRIAITIILNGLHHLQRDHFCDNKRPWVKKFHFYDKKRLWEEIPYAEYLAQNLDLWVIAEGASLSQGSTSWCKAVPDNWHLDGRSIDGTVEYLSSLAARHKNVKVLNHFRDPILHGDPVKYPTSDWHADGFWESKDAMVNACISYIKTTFDNAPKFLWEIDADEIWTVDQMISAEVQMYEQAAKTGMFLADYWVGKTLQAKGEWGEGRKLPYRRLWRWEGEYFKTHEPPMLEGGNGKEILLPQRFQHYAYYYEQDVLFKNDWYRGHEGIYERWQRINREAENAPVGTTWPISDLIVGGWGKTQTVIEKVKEAPDG